MTKTIRVCQNLACRLGLPPSDENTVMFFPGSNSRCPRCGTPWKARPAWKGRSPEDYDEFDYERE